MTEERLWVFLDVFDDMKKVNIISLGCSKNLVDTEMLLKQLDQAGYDTETDVENSDAEVVIVNTCGFIGDAKEESVNTILEQVERKKEGIVEQVYVIGCLSQRYGAELQEEIPEVDAFFGKFDWKGVLERMGEHFDERIRNQRVLTPRRPSIMLCARSSAGTLGSAPRGGGQRIRGKGPAPPPRRSP